MIAAGELKDRATIYAPTPQTDVYGDVTNVYVMLSTVFCAVRKQRGNIVDAGQELQYVYPLLFTFRRQIAVGEWYVIRHKGSYYSVDSVLRYDDRIEVVAHTIDPSLLHFAE